VVNYEANFDLIFELFPSTKVIGVPYNAGERNSQFGVEQIKKLAEKRGVTLKLVSVANSQEVIDAVRSLTEQVDLIYVGSDNTVVSAIAGLTKVAYERGKPVIASDSGSVQDGALAAVSVDYVQVGRKAGQLVADVLRTHKTPGEIEPVRYLGNSLLLNAKAASVLKYEFSASVKVRAKKIIE
jgi:putative ABC transport system substrate-binding protein